MHPTTPYLFLIKTIKWHRKLQPELLGDGTEDARFKKQDALIKKIHIRAVKDAISNLKVQSKSPKHCKAHYGEMIMFVCQCTNLKQINNSVSLALLDVTYSLTS